MDQRIIQLYDEFTHCHLDRRLFPERLAAVVPRFEAALKEAGKTYTLHVYEGVNHAFHNDTASARYNAEAARLAWSRTIEFFNRTLR